MVDKENGPKTLNDVKLIHAGKILENNKTLAESRLQVGEFPGGVITMHVVVRPPVSDKKNGKINLYYVLCFSEVSQHMQHFCLNNMSIIVTPQVPHQIEDRQ